MQAIAQYAIAHISQMKLDNYFLTVHRIIELLGLEGTLKILKLQPPAAGWVDEGCQTYTDIFFIAEALLCTSFHLLVFHSVLLGENNGGWVCGE